MGDLVDHDLSVKYGEQQKHCNAVFDNAQPSIFSLLDTIKVEARSWAKAGAVGLGVLLPSIAP